MSWLRLMLVFAVAAVLAGCGPRAQSVKPPEVSAKEAVTKALEGIAQSGQGGSEIGTIMQDLDRMKATDPQLAEALIEDANQMMSMSNPAQIKAKAQEMLGKLGAGGGGGQQEGGEP